MHQLFPSLIDDVAIESAYATPPGEPWLRVSMVMSVDGAATDENDWTTALAGEPDARMLRALRSVADAVVVGAGTVRTGRLGPIRTKRADDPAQTARLVIVSGSLDLDWELPLFATTQAPIVVTSAAGATHEMPAVIRQQLVVAGAGAVDLVDAVKQLHDRGFARLLCEGGPGLAASMFDAGAVDELCLTQAPVVMPADRLRGISLTGQRIPLHLTQVGEDTCVLFLRYRSSRGT
jgi:riboflavin biosynthesis pyrimidine reductase